MRMKNPPHPGELIGDTLYELGWTMTDAARGLAMSRQQLHNIVSGKSAITPEVAIKLEGALGSTADAWLRLRNAYDLAQLHQSSATPLIERFTPRPTPA